MHHEVRKRHARRQRRRRRAEPFGSRRGRGFAPGWTYYPAGIQQGPPAPPHGRGLRSGLRPNSEGSFPTSPTVPKRSSRRSTAPARSWLRHRTLCDTASLRRGGCSHIFDRRGLVAGMGWELVLRGLVGLAQASTAVLGRKSAGAGAAQMGLVKLVIPFDRFKAGGRYGLCADAGAGG